MDWGSERVDWGFPVLGGESGSVWTAADWAGDRGNWRISRSGWGIWLCACGQRRNGTVRGVIGEFPDLGGEFGSVWAAEDRDSERGN